MCNKNEIRWNSGKTGKKCNNNFKTKKGYKIANEFASYKPAVSLFFSNHHELRFWYNSFWPANITGRYSLWILNNKSHSHTNPDMGENKWVWEALLYGICCSWEGIWLSTVQTICKRGLKDCFKHSGRANSDHPTRKQKSPTKSNAIVLSRLFSILPGSYINEATFGVKLTAVWNDHVSNVRFISDVAFFKLSHKPQQFLNDINRKIQSLGLLRTGKIRNSYLPKEPKLSKMKYLVNCLHYSVFFVCLFVFLP